MRGCFVLVSNDKGWEEVFPSIGEAEAVLQISVSNMRKCARSHKKIRSRLGLVEIDIQRKQRME